MQREWNDLIFSILSKQKRQEQNSNIQCIDQLLLSSPPWLRNQQMNTRIEYRSGSLGIVYQYTALQLFTILGTHELARHLVQAGADILIESTDSQKTALHFAAESRNSMLINEILDSNQYKSLSQCDKRKFIHKKCWNYGFKTPLEGEALSRCLTHDIYPFSFEHADQLRNKINILRKFISQDKSHVYLNDILIYICTVVPFPEGLRYILARGNSFFDDQLIVDMSNRVRRELQRPFPKFNHYAVYEILQEYMHNQILIVLKQQKKFLPYNFAQFIK